MFLDHHTIPLASGHHLVIVMTEQRVTAEAVLHTLSPAVSVGQTGACQMLVHSLRIVHIIEVGHRLYGEEHALAVGIDGSSGNLLQQTEGLSL